MGIMILLVKLLHNLRDHLLVIGTENDLNVWLTQSPTQSVATENSKVHPFQAKRNSGHVVTASPSLLLPSLNGHGALY
jgi:hypothetical protein